MHGAHKPGLTHLKAGDTLVRQGDPGSDPFLVLDGVIRVDRDGEQLAEECMLRTRRRRRPAHG